MVLFLWKSFFITNAVLLFLYSLYRLINTVISGTSAFFCGLTYISITCFDEKYPEWNGGFKFRSLMTLKCFTCGKFKNPYGVFSFHWSLFPGKPLLHSQLQHGLSELIYLNLFASKVWFKTLHVRARGSISWRFCFWNGRSSYRRRCCGFAVYVLMYSLNMNGFINSLSWLFLLI